MSYEIRIERPTTPKRTSAVHVMVITIRNGMMIASATIQPENIGAFLSMVIMPDTEAQS